MGKHMTLLAAIFAAATMTPAQADDLAEPGAPIDGYDELANGAIYVKEEHGDWRIRCVKNDQGADPCQMYQLILDNTGGAVAQILINEITSSETFAVAGAMITVPLETALSEDFLMQIDDHPPKAYPYAFCNTAGCHVRLGLTPVDLNWLKSGSVAKLATVPYREPDTRRVLPMSLTGFTAAYDAMLKANLGN